MSERARTTRAWAQRHSPTLVNGACLLAAWWLAPILWPGAALPLAGLVLALVTLSSVRTLAPEPTAGYRRHAWLHLRSQLTAGVVCVVAGRLVWNWPWPTFACLPLSTVLTGLALCRHLPERWRRDPLASFPGADTALSGALLAGATSFLFGRLALPESVSGLAIATLAVGWFALDRVPFSRWQEATGGGARLARFAARLLIWAVGSGIVLVLAGDHPTRVQLALILVPTLAVALFGLSHRSRLVTGQENAARTLYGLAVAALIYPFACHRMLGLQDAQWYMNTLADFLAQVRAGVFPVFVGQSEHLFNGGVLPVRFAPLFQHYGLLLDCLTLRSLPVDALQNAIIVATFIGAALSSWAILARIVPGRPWLVTALSLFYLTCPGVLAIAFVEDLYMTWTTLPWLPLVFGGCVLSFHSRDASPLLVAGAALGFVWWGHSPVAMWTTLAFGVIQAARLVTLSPRHWPWPSLLVGAGACLGIASYPLVSVLAVPVLPGTAMTEAIDPELIIRILYFIRQSFPGVLVPAFLAKTRSLADYQLGWALLFAIGLIAAAMIRQRVKSPAAWVLLAVPVVLQLLLLPIPGLASSVWPLLPAALINPTGAWPMQRLYVIMAAGVVCAAAAAVQRTDTAARSVPGWLSGVMAVALLGSALAAWPIVQLKGGQRRSLALAADLTLPENHVQTRYSYLFFAHPPGYFSHGHVEPLYENRFLAADDRRLVGGNPAAILAAATAGRVLSEGTLTSSQPHPGAAWDIAPRFTMEPHKRYALELHFAHPAEPGVLLVAGGLLQRTYALPRYGEAFAFGSGPSASPLLPLHTSGDQPQEVNLRFVAQPAGPPANLGQFGTFRWIEVDPSRLPVQVTHWIPYRAEVNAPAGCWLETPRMYQPGYRATVNGRSVAVEQSPEGLVAVPVPVGRSAVTLVYQPPPLLQLAYWLSVAAMVASAGFLLGRRRSPSTTA